MPLVEGPEKDSLRARALSAVGLKVRVGVRIYSSRSCNSNVLPTCKSDSVRDPLPMMSDFWSPPGELRLLDSLDG
jgi:hypothetical protein